MLKEFLKREKMVLNFGDGHTGPHILAFELEPRDKQIKKFDKMKFEKPIHKKCRPLKIQINSTSCCAYPSKTYLKSVVGYSGDYKDRPYILLLALEEP